MDEERNEIYERIPWETLERKGPDRQWLLFAIAGAVVLGALAYSFMSTRPVNLSQPAVTTPSTVATAPVVTVTVPPASSPSTAPAGPVLLAEADLYAIDPDKWVTLAAAHAEWFVAEYLSFDGSERSTATMDALLPNGVSMGDGPSDRHVFVEWVRTVDVEEAGPLRYRVEVIARTLLAVGEEPYVRQAPVMLIVEVLVDEAGPRVAFPPEIDGVEVAPQSEIGLVEVPEDVAAQVLATGATEILGGVVSPEGVWRVVVLAPGPDGVSRPQTVTLP